MGIYELANNLPLYTSSATCSSLEAEVYQISKTEYFNCMQKKSLFDDVLILNKIKQRIHQQQEQLIAKIMQKHPQTVTSQFSINKLKAKQMSHSSASDASSHQSCSTKLKPIILQKLAGGHYGLSDLVA